MRQTTDETARPSRACHASPTPGHLIVTAGLTFGLAFGLTLATIAIVLGPSSDAEPAVLTGAPRHDVPVASSPSSLVQQHASVPQASRPEPESRPISFVAPPARDHARPHAPATAHHGSDQSLLHEVVAAPTLDARIAALDQGLPELGSDAQAAFLVRLVATTPGRGQDEIEAFRLVLIGRFADFTWFAPVQTQLCALLVPGRPRSERMAALEVLERGDGHLGGPVERQLALVAGETDDAVLAEHARGLLLTSSAVEGRPPPDLTAPAADEPVAEDR